MCVHICMKLDLFLQLERQFLQTCHFEGGVHHLLGAFHKQAFFALTFFKLNPKP